MNCAVRALLRSLSFSQGRSREGKKCDECINYVLEIYSTRIYGARGEIIRKIFTMIYRDVFKKKCLVVFFSLVLALNTIDKCFRLHDINLVSNFLTPHTQAHNALNKNHLS